MKTNSAIDLSVATPFGWITSVQPAFDLSSLASFRNQLISLQKAVDMPGVEVGAHESEPVAVPVLARPRS